MKLAARAGRIAPSPTLAMAATAKAMAARGIDVADFSSGEPDFDTPEPVKAAAEAAIRAGFTKYTPSSGIDELRQAIIDKLQSEQGLRYEKSQVLVSCGAKHSLYNLAEALLEAGDEVIIPVPYWVSYADQTLLNDATPIFLPTREEDGYAIDDHALERLITTRTKAIIVNSPCNPTGATYDRGTLERLAELALRRDLLLISDEIYEKILYDGATHTSIASLGPEVAARTVVINGVSKAYAMTGWRIGYGWPQRFVDRHGEYSKPEYVQPLFHFTKGCRRGLARRWCVHRKDGDRVRSEAARHGRAPECDARRSLPNAHRSILCVPQCEWAARKAEPKRNNPHSDRSCKLPAAGIQGRDGSW